MRGTFVVQDWLRHWLRIHNLASSSASSTFDYDALLFSFINIIESSEEECIKEVKRKARNLSSLLRLTHCRTSLRQPTPLSNLSKVSHA